MTFQWRSRRVLLAVCALGVLLAGRAQAAEELVAKVGGVPITTYELQREQQRLLPFNVGFHGGLPQEKIAQIREEALTRLIERAYKVQYALAEEISVDNVAVEKRLEAIRAKFKTKKDFEKALGREGLKEFRLSLYRDLLAGKAEELAVGSKIKVTDAQVRENYETNKAMYLRPRQFKASHILVKVDPSANREEREALLKKAEDLAARAKAGEDFYNLAYYNSDDRSRYVGGDLGYFHEGQTAKEFEDALKKMKSGEVSGLVKTMFGYHIIKLVEVNEPRQFEFDEVKDKIRQSLEKKQRETLYEEWMKGLKSKYQVQRFGN